MAERHLPLTIQIRWTKHAGHCRRSKDKLVSDVLLWTPTYGRPSVGRLTRTYLQQLCGYRCSLEDLLGVVDDRTNRAKESRKSMLAAWLDNDEDEQNILSTTEEEKTKYISNFLLWTPTHGHANVSWPAKTYIHRLGADTVCSLENWTKVMDSSDR